MSNEPDRDDESVEYDSPSIGIGFPRLARTLRRASVALAGSAMLSGIAGHVATRTLPVIGSSLQLLSGFMIVVALLALIGSPFATSGGFSQPGRIRARGHGLDVSRGSKNLRFDAAQIAQGLEREGPLVEAVWDLRDGTRITADVGTHARAKAMLLATGSDASGHRAEFDTAHWTSTVGRLLISGILGCCTSAVLSVGIEEKLRWLRGTEGLHFLFFWLLIVATFMTLTARPRVVVGTDGIAVERPLFSTFVPFGDFLSVSVNSDVIDIRTPKRVVRIKVGGLAMGDRDALADRINKARRAGASRRSKEWLDPLDRRGRPFGSWLDELSELLGNEKGYREIAVTKADVENALADPAAPAERRIAAAVALAAKSDPDDLTRIRVVASSCANEHVKTALERAADHALAESDVERAMDRHEAPDP